MHIDGLAPLQTWLDKINDYFTKGETTKARLATLVLPLFEALGCLCIMRRICFPLSRDRHESQSQLLTKATHLALNIIRAPVNGCRRPQDTYQQHIELNLIVDPFQLVEQKLKQAAPARIPLNNDLIEQEAVDNPPPKKQKPRRRVQDIIESIRNAPDSLRKRDSFQIMTKEKAKETVRHHETLPRNIQLVDKIPGEEKLSAPKDELANLERLLEEHPSSEKLTEESQQQNEKALAVFGPLIHKIIPKSGTWKVKKDHIYFRQGKTAYLDPKIIDVIAAAKDKGLLSKLNYDQTYMLYQNLLIIDSSSETKKNDHLSKLTSVMETLQNQFKALWVEQEYSCGKLHQNCVKLLTKLHDLIRQGQGQPNEENLGLFSNSPSQDIVRIFDGWQSANFARKKRQAAVKQTIDDYYEILKAYFKELPPILRLEWKHLKEPSTKEEFLPVLKSLSAEDQQLLTQFLRFFSIAFKEIWASFQDEKLSQEEKIRAMFQETKDLLQWICPDAEQNQFGALPEVILNFDTIFPN